MPKINPKLNIINTPFPVSALPKAVADICEELSNSFEVPLELPCTTALGLLAACCQKKAIVRINTTYAKAEETLNNALELFPKDPGLPSTRLNKNETINMESMMKICRVLGCDIGDIVEMTDGDNLQQGKEQKSEQYKPCHNR